MKKEEDFVMGLSIYMACLREKKRYSTAKSYQDALNSFKCFCGMEAIPYAYINRNRLLCYQSWLLDKGRSLNTVSTYMRRIRHIYNLAVEANEAPFVPNLFKDVLSTFFPSLSPQVSRDCPLGQHYSCRDSPPFPALLTLAAFTNTEKPIPQKIECGHRQLPPSDISWPSIPAPSVTGREG